ncbi:MAG: peptidoglycan editing factor PgeF [Thioalkalispiraceae bacterium]
MDKHSWLAADWPAPANVHAGTTTRVGGVSETPYASFNLAQHVGDDPARVEQNRQRLKAYLNLPDEPVWLNQVHGCQVSTDDAILPEADACITQTRGRVCVVMTADCLPVLITDKSGTCVAAVHAGWRGLEQGAIGKTIAAMPANKAELLAWLGPAIGPEFFEVGEEVRELFLKQKKEHVDAFATGRQPGKWLMDVYRIARRQLADNQVTEVYGGGLCTFRDAQRFYSYRRNKVTGRMASLVWMD